MKRFDERDDNRALLDINTTPLIDVMLVLLILLIITIPTQIHVTKLDLPQDSTAPDMPPTVIRIEIGADGQVKWDGRLVVDRAALEKKLQQAALSPVEPEVQLHPDKAVRYEYVMAVMAAVQRAGIRGFGIEAI